MLEKIKEKQKQEILNYIEKELRQQFQKEDNEEKYFFQKQKEIDLKRDLSRRNKIQDLEKKRREMIKEDKEKFNSEQKIQAIE